MGQKKRNGGGGGISVVDDDDDVASVPSSHLLDYAAQARQRHSSGKYSLCVRVESHAGNMPANPYSLHTLPAAPRPPSRLSFLSLFFGVVIRSIIISVCDSEEETRGE